MSSLFSMLKNCSKFKTKKNSCLSLNGISDGLIKDYLMKTKFGGQKQFFKASIKIENRHEVFFFLTAYLVEKRASNYNAHYLRVFVVLIQKMSWVKHTL